MSVVVYPGIVTSIAQGGQSAVVFRGPLLGGVIFNPVEAPAQGLPYTEDLFVSLVGPASLEVSGTCWRIQPGQKFNVPNYYGGDVNVTAASSGHKFTAFFFTEGGGFEPYHGLFPPPLPTALANVIKAYLYQEYADDEDLQAFVASYNAMAQQRVDWFNEINLPIYTLPNIQGALLDWVGAGLYGYPRPSLPSPLFSKNKGMFNTWRLNTWRFNRLEIIGESDPVITTDDVYKRILTWHFYKGDGHVINIRWLKRRVMRFLYGVDGTAPNIDQTYPVSVNFGPPDTVNINFLTVFRVATGGALFNVPRLNNFRFNQLDSYAISVPPTPYVSTFKAAMDAGLLEMPFQFATQVNVQS